MFGMFGLVTASRHRRLQARYDELSGEVRLMQLRDRILFDKVERMKKAIELLEQLLHGGGRTGPVLVPPPSSHRKAGI